MRARRDRWTRLAGVGLAAPAVAALARYQPAHLGLGIKVLVALAVVALVANRPEPALLALVALLPFQLLVLAATYRLGLPAAVVVDLGLWKEAVVAGCLVAVLRVLRDRRRPLDAVDLLGLIYLGIVGLYYLFPTLLVHPSGPSGAGPPTGLTTLATALRNDTAFVVLLLAVRRLPLSVGFRRRLVTTLVVAGTVVAASGAFEFLFSYEWNSLMVSTLQVPRYLSDVLKVSVANPVDIRVYSTVGGRDVLRIGSVFLDPLSCGFYLVVALGIGLERVSRGARHLGNHVGTGLVGAAILLTQTRAAIIAGLVVVACTLKPVIDRRGPRRTPYTILVVTGLLAIVPLTVATGVAARASGTIGGHETSTRLHVDRSSAGIRALTAQPLGRGLGTGATNGSRFLVATTLTSEDYYLQVGNETGAVSMLVFIALIVMVNRRMRRLLHQPADILAAGCRGVFLGLSLAALLLQVWLGLAVAWTVWLGLGVCLAVPGGPLGPGPGPQVSDLRRHVSAVARRWPVILATVATGVLAVQLLLPKERRFTAHRTVVVGLRQFLARPGRTDPYFAVTAGLDRQRTVYALAVTQPSLVADGRQRAGVAREPGVVVAETRAVARPNSQLLEISVSDTDPSVARALADGLAQALIAHAPALQQPGVPVLSVSLSGPPAWPTSPDPDGSHGRLADAAVLGLLGAVGLAILNSHLDVSTVAMCQPT